MYSTRPLPLDMTFQPRSQILRTIGNVTSGFLSELGRVLLDFTRQEHTSEIGCASTDIGFMAQVSNSRLRDSQAVSNTF